MIMLHELLIFIPMGEVNNLHPEKPKDRTRILFLVVGEDLSVT